MSTDPARMYPEPISRGVSTALIEQWVYDSSFTHYRVLVVDTPAPFGDPNDLYPPSTYLLVEPHRSWFPVNRDADVIAETYIQEKTGTSGSDSRALTTLVATALERKPKYIEEGS